MFWSQIDRTTQNFENSELSSMSQVEGCIPRLAMPFENTQ